jgi:hypothetical protein
MFNSLCNVVDYFIILGDMAPKHKSGCAKRNKRKRDLALAESQKGALKRYFPATSSVDVNNDNQTEESEHDQDDDHNSNVDHEVNEESSGQGK